MSWKAVLIQFLAVFATLVALGLVLLVMGTLGSRYRQRRRSHP